MAQKETAEQKLLKIIEASKKAQSVTKAEGLSGSVPRKKGRAFSFNVQQANVFLVVCMVASVLFFGYEVRNGMTLLQQPVDFNVDINAPKDSANLFVPQMKNIAFYLDKVGSRNIFQPYEKKVATVNAVPSGQEELAKKMSKFKVVGIAWLDVPESATVMLEDTTNRMTHFLKEGDKVEDVIVKTIYTDRVVFGRANEEITIKL
ncbi:MAG: hypothetical protein HQL22_02560 [Candidatus Omnitrophica bacterium]|nr:hypothetical protein [Candidatus Omnitrophota bacterium]